MEIVIGIVAGLICLVVLAFGVFVVLAGALLGSQERAARRWRRTHRVH